MALLYTTEFDRLGRLFNVSNYNVISHYVFIPRSWWRWTDQRTDETFRRFSYLFRNFFS